MSGKAGSAISGVTSALSKMGPVGIAVGAVFAAVALAIAGVVKAASSVASKVDSLAKRAKSVDMTANGYIALSHACAAAGVSMDKMLVIVQKVDDAIVKASEGSKKARDAFYGIGLSWRDLERMTPEQRIFAIVDAMKQLEEEGKNVPSEFRDLIGRRGMAELNKAKKEDFSKIAAEANALGFTITPEAVALAEQYQTTMGEAGQKLLATFANMKMIQEAQNTINDLTKKWTESIGDAHGKVSREMRELGYIGIGDVANQELSKLKETNGNVKLSWLNHADLRKAIEKHLLDADPGLSQDEAALKQAIDLQIKEFLSKSDVADMPKWFREAFFRQIASMHTNYGFNVDDMSTWVKKVSDETTLTPEERAWSVANDSVDDYVRAMKAAATASQDNVAKMKELYNVEQQVAMIEEKLRKELKDQNAQLSETLKLKMNIAMLDAQRAKAEEASANFEKYKKDAYTTAQASIFSSSGYSSSTKFLIEQLKSVQPVGGFTIEDQLRKGAEEYNANVKNEDDKINMDIFNEPTSIEKLMNGMTAAQLTAVANNIERKMTTGNFSADDSQIRAAVKQVPEVVSGIDDDTLKALKLDSLGGQFMALRVKKDPKEFAEAVANLVNTTNEKLDEYIERYEQAEQEAGHELPAHGTYEKILKLRAAMANIQDQQAGLKMLEDAATFAKDMKTLIDMQQTIAATRSMEATGFDKLMSRRGTYGRRIGDRYRIDEANDYEFLKAAGVDVSSAEKLAAAREKYAEQLDKNRQSLEWDAQERWASFTQNNARNIGWQAMQKMGLGTQAAIQKGRYEATEAKGAPLTRAELAVVDRLSYLSDKLSQGFNMPNFSETVHTNELASKGGFVGGVTVDNNDTPRKQLAVLQTTSRQVGSIAAEVNMLYNALNNY